MNVLRRLRPSPAMVVACIALAFALGGTGYAALKLPKNSVTSVQVKDFSLLSRDFKSGQLPQGPPGPAGPAGPAARWALVLGSGQIAAQSGGISVRHVDVGYYVLDFGSPVTGKLILASHPSAAGLGGQGSVSAGPCSLTPEGDNCATGNDPRFVRVLTYESTNNGRTDTAFYVAVIG